ncbi:MAG: NADH-quinone oxidoreductase subunit L [Candidatus Micrarchaeia archaeon]
MLYLLVAIPMIIAAFLSIILYNFPKLPKYIALAGSLISLMIAILIFIEGHSDIIQTFNWFSIDNITASLSFAVYPINMIALLIVAGMTPLIILYSFGFMRMPTEQGRFYFEISIFAASMMIFVISYSLIAMFIAWEMLGIMSYLLIGFWYWKENVPKAAQKAISMVFIGDILFLIGIIIIGLTYGNFNISSLYSLPFYPQVSIALILILFAAFSKGAQFPFTEWLPDAMEGPTPVSAYLHSSTMVKAGIILIAVILPIYSAYNLLWLILIIGFISAIIGATNALTTKHIKKVLAYSTIEDIGLMFIALGLNNIFAAIMLFVAQTFYKALLFLDSGAIMKANDDREDIYKIYGASQNKLIYISLIFGVLSLASIFPLSGFFGKAVIISTSSGISYLLLILIEILSSFYIFRWFFVIIRKDGDDELYRAINYKSTSKLMLLPIFILTLLIIFASILYFYIPHYIGISTTINTNIPIYELIISTVIAIIAIYFTYLIFYKHKLVIKESYKWYKPLYNIFNNNIFINSFYLYTALFFEWIAGIFLGIEISIDKFLSKIGHSILSFNNFIRRIENGQINTYALSFILGILFLIIIIYIFY